MQFQPFLRQLGRWAWLIVICTLVAGIAGLVVSRQLSPLYRASATLLISDRYNMSGGMSLQSLTSSETVVATYVQLVERRPVLEQVIRDLGLRSSPEQLARSVRVEALPSTQLITIMADAAAPEQAALLANSLAATLRDLGPQLLGPAWAATTLSIVEPASPPVRPIFPRTVLNVIVAAVLGALAGSGLVALRYLLVRPIETASTLQCESGLAVLAEIPAGRGDARLLISAPAGGEPEAYRHLRASLVSIAPADRSWAIAVTSPGQDEGKSSVAAHAAVAMARSGRNVILVDANLRRPRLHDLFGVANTSGLASALRRGEGLLQDYLLRSAVPNLRLLTAGVVGPASVELLASRELGILVQALRAEAEIIILDCGPAVEVADGVEAARACDAVLLVVRSGATRVADVQRAREQFEQAGIPVIGAVLRSGERTGGVVASLRGPAHERAFTASSAPEASESHAGD